MLTLYPHCECGHDLHCSDRPLKDAAASRFGQPQHLSGGQATGNSDGQTVELTKYDFELDLDWIQAVVQKTIGSGVGWAKWTSLFQTKINTVLTMQDVFFAIQTH